MLFVCHGNICRSPYAEEAFRRLTGNRVVAASAGLAGPEERPPPDTARRVALERGVDLIGHRSRIVSSESLLAAGMVIVMDPAHARLLAHRHGYRHALVLGDLDPEPIRRRRIRDPIFQPPDLFRRVYERIDSCLVELAENLGLPATRGERAP